MFQHPGRILIAGFGYFSIIMAVALMMTCRAQLSAQEPTFDFCAEQVERGREHPPGSDCETVLLEAARDCFDQGGLWRAPKEQRPSCVIPIEDCNRCVDATLSAPANTEVSQAESRRRPAAPTAPSSESATSSRRQANLAPEPPRREASRVVLAGCPDRWTVNKISGNDHTASFRAEDTYGNAVDASWAVSHGEITQGQGSSLLTVSHHGYVKATATACGDRKFAAHKVSRIPWRTIGSIAGTVITILTLRGGNGGNDQPVVRRQQ